MDRSFTVPPESLTYFSINFMLHKSERKQFHKQGLGLYFFKNQSVGIFNTTT